MPFDRDRRRDGDPLHDTVDEESGVVRDAVDPDDTPIDKLLSLIREDVGLLSARDERLIRAVEAHRKRGQERRAAAVPPEVDRAQLASLLSEDMAQWEPFRRMRAAVDACEAERLAREKRAKWLNPLRNVGIGGLIAALLWAVRVLNEQGVAAEQARQRDREHEQALRDVRELQDWRIEAEVLLGRRARFNRNEPDRSDP